MKKSSIKARAAQSRRDKKHFTLVQTARKIQRMSTEELLALLKQLAERGKPRELDYVRQALAIKIPMPMGKHPLSSLAFKNFKTFGRLRRQRHSH